MVDAAHCEAALTDKQKLDALGADLTLYNSNVHRPS